MYSNDSLGNSVSAFGSSTSTAEFFIILLCSSDGPRDNLSASGKYGEEISCSSMGCEKVGFTLRETMLGFQEDFLLSFLKNKPVGRPGLRLKSLSVAGSEESTSNFDLISKISISNCSEERIIFVLKTKRFLRERGQSVYRGGKVKVVSEDLVDRAGENGSTSFCSSNRSFFRWGLTTSLLMNDS